MTFPSHNNFVVFDVETTGLSPQRGDRIVEIAALRVENFKVTRRFETLINPQRDISWGAFRVNGITEEMLIDAPLAEDILPDLLYLVKDACIVGHNIHFDLRFINHEFTLAGWPPLEDMSTIDTVQMAKIFLPGLNSYSLSSVARSLGIFDRQSHRAMLDTEMTFQIFCHLSDMARQQKMKPVPPFPSGIHRPAASVDSILK